MFNIVLSVNSSEKNKMDKAITPIATLSGTLKETTSIIDPVIIIEGNLSDYTGCNYMTIEAFGRSYFVNNIKSVNNGLIEITAHVDVLSTYKNAIRRNRAIIRKQEHAWNLYLNDGSLRVYQDPEVIVKTFPSGFTKMEFVLAVAGS
jgi:hypothetical protein